MTNQDTNDFLAHYGVLGMQWGKRKTQSVRVRRNPPSEDHTTSRKVLKTPLNQVSTKDLQVTTKRLQQEKQLRELRTQTATISRGQTQVKALLAIAGTATSVIAFTKSDLGKNLINKGKPFVNKLIQSKGKHTLHYVAPAVKVIKEAARHI